MTTDLTPQQREFYAILDRSARLLRFLTRVVGPRVTAETLAYLEPAPRERNPADDH